MSWSWKKDKYYINNNKLREIVMNTERYRLRSSGLSSNDYWDCYSFRFQEDNILFIYDIGETVRIILRDGYDKFEVYNSKWLYRGNWCQKILDILNKVELEIKEEKVRLKQEEETKLTNKINKYNELCK